MDLEKLSKPLTIDQIDFRIQSINKGKYATILAYKDARVDMQRLDDVCGVLNWKREHVRDNANCIVSIWDEEKKQWVSKEDTGTESMTEKQKGLASDSFKRACFNLGIGRELYGYPVISIKLYDNEVVSKDNGYKASYNLNLKDWNWDLKVSDKGSVNYLSATDTNGVCRFTYENGNKKGIPELKPSEAWEKAKQYISQNGNISSIKSKYYISEDNEKILRSAIG